MTAYTAHDKLAKSLGKLTDYQLASIPTTITVVKIVKAKTDEGKRNLVRAAIFTEREITQRKYESEFKS